MKDVDQYIFMSYKKLINSRIGINSIYSILDQILNVGLNFVLAILFARKLGASSLGQYNIALAITGVISLITNFGTGTVVSRAIASNSDKLKTYLGNALAIRIYISTPLLIIFSAFVSRILGYNFDTFIIIILVALYNTFLSSIRLINSTFVSLHKNDIVFKINTANKTCSLLLAFIILKLGLGLIEMIIGFIIVSSSFLIYSYYEIRKFENSFRFQLNLKFSKTLIFLSFPLVLASTAEFINLKIDNIFISYILDEEAVGYYSASFNIFMALTLIPLGLTQVYFPNFIEAFKKSRNIAFSLFIKYLKLISIYSIFSLCFFQI